jgi:hypothetical protein
MPAAQVQEHLTRVQPARSQHVASGIYPDGPLRHHLWSR